MRMLAPTLRATLGATLAVILAACGGGGGDAAADAPPACTQTPVAVDWQRQFAAGPWQARDSAAEAVFGDRMWLMGGWFDSYQPTPRDVWSSPDGQHWSETTPQAPWTAGDLASSLSYGGRLWLLGGWSGGRLAGAHASNEVWATRDGAAWTRVSNAQWSPRLGAAVIEFNGRMWLLGGTENYYFGDASSLRNDVWSTADGVQWTRVLEHAPWTPRAYHQAFVHDGKMWVVGGGNYVPEYTAYNDVWSSPDGTHWTQVTAQAPWHPRIWFASAVFHGAMWVLGGWSNDPYRNWGDVWYSTDGAHWAQLESTTAWTARHEASAYVFEDRLWMVGGFDEPLTNDAWSLALPQGWLPSCDATGSAG